MNPTETDRTYRDSVLAATAAALPLYVASMLVTLAGVGSVGVTATTGSWTTIWSCLVVLGHLASLGLRLIGVQPLPLFFPVMAIGGGLAIRLAMDGSSIIGFDDSMLNLPVDMATSVVLAILAAVRTFTLVTNASLLFSIVPVVAMLALVGSSNPNAEVLLFFGLAVLGGLFTSGYELHVRRSLEAGRAPAPVLLHLISAWAVTLTVALLALMGPLAVQPALAPLSPFAFSHRLRNLVNINPVNQQQTPVGQGPINLSPTVVYEIYTNSGRKFRTGVYTVYTGRSWTPGDESPVATVRTEESVELTNLPASLPVAQLRMNLFTFPRDPSRPLSLKREQIEQLIVTRARNSESIPAQGWVRSLGYPQPTVVVNESGVIAGNSHTFADRMVQLTAEAVDPPPELLRKAPPVDPDEFWDMDTLMLPQSTYDVQLLARRVTSSATNSFDKVMSIMRHIETTCSYTLQGDYTPPGEDAAAHYLFKSRRGACDLAATAGAVMSRAVGVPSRIVVGYVADEPLPDGNGYLVRQEHAHMWFECFFAGYGWVEFDPAPPSADIQDHPWDVLLARIRRGLSRVGGGGLDAALLVSVVFLTFLMAAYRLFVHLRKHLARRARRRRSGSPSEAIAAQYRKTLAALGKRGWNRAPHVTPSEYLAGLAQAWADEPAPVDSLAELTRLHEAAIYGGQANEADVERAQAAARTLLRRAPRKAPEGKRTPASAPAAV